MVGARARRLQPGRAVFLLQAQYALDSTQADQHGVTEQRIHQRMTRRADLFGLGQAPLGILQLP